MGLNHGKTHGVRSGLALALGLCTMAAARAQEGGAATSDEVQPAAHGTAHTVWDFEQGDYSFSEVVAGDGFIFALDRKGKIHALDSTEGDVMWSSQGKDSMSYTFGFDVIQRPELDAVVVGCDTGLFALDRETGHEVWRTEINLGVAGPACAEKAIVAAGSDGYVYGFDIESGKVLWKHEFVEDRPEDPPGFDGENARFQGRPARPGDAATDGKVVAISVFDQCRTLCVDAETGKRLWSFSSKGWMGPTPTFGPEDVYVGSQDKHLYAVNKATGKLHWKVKTGGRISGGAAWADDSVYFGSCDARLYSVDRATGEVRWKFETDHDEGFGASIYSRPLVIGNTVHLAAMRGTVYAVDRSSGDLRWRYEPMAGSAINSDLVMGGGCMVMTTRSREGSGESTVVAIRADD